MGTTTLGSRIFTTSGLQVDTYSRCALLLHMMPSLTSRKALQLSIISNLRKVRFILEHFEVDGPGGGVGNARAALMKAIDIFGAYAPFINSSRIDCP